jgi:hypothetical protein
LLKVLIMTAFFLLALIALTILFGIGLLAAVAVLAMVKNRPVITAFAGGLLLLGLLLPAGLVASYVSVRSPAPVAFAGHPDAVRLKASVWFVGISLVAGAAIAILASVKRPATSSSHEPRPRRWWPALLVLPLLLLFFLGTFRARKSLHDVPPPLIGQPIMAFDSAERQYAELGRPKAQLSADLERRINEMDIHELMDQFDAPQIVISAQSPASIPWLALARLATALDAKSQKATAAEAAEKESSNSAAAVVASVTPNRDEDDVAQVEAEADAAVALIAADNELQGDTADHTEATHAEARELSALDAQSADEPDKATSASIASAPPRAAEPKQHAEAEESTHIFEPHIAGGVNTDTTDTNRPKWVNDRRKRVGDIRREVIVTDEYATENECYEARDIYLLLKTYEHLQRLMGLPYYETMLPSIYCGKHTVTSDGTEVTRDGPDIGKWQFDDGRLVWQDSRLRQLQAMGVSLDYVQREIATDEHLETVSRSFGPMKKLYTLIEFSPAVDSDLRQRWVAYERESRLAAVGFGAGGILGLLSMVYGLLKVDTWTKGYYTKRLFLGVPAAIIGLVALLGLLRA